MSRSKLSSSPGFTLLPSSCDARVEMLLILGIIFLCWQFIHSHANFIAEGDAPPLTLCWSGCRLTAATGASPVAGPAETAIPASVTPFLFLPIPVNYADRDLLMTVSGVGPELARKIVETRTTRGFYGKASDLLAVPGIGPAKMKQFAPMFSFEVR